jgi:hypothetical protein
MIKRLRIAFATAGLCSVIFVVFAQPSVAEKRTLLIKLAGGSQTVVTVDVPPGTPVSAIKLPTLALPIVSVVDITPPEAPAPAPTPTPTPPSDSTGPTGSTGSTGSGGSTGSNGSTGTTGTNGGKNPKPKPRPDDGQVVGKVVTEDLTPAKQKAKPPVRDETGRPTLDNPSLSVAIPGPAPIGVPNFFIEKFRIPPFLLPIYQAAGIEYGVPWQVLAAINEIETDYGRNLNVSSAGALGWMQFIPSSWRTYGVDANADGRKDPYNPVDAIFAAARYLRAAGAEKDIRRAVFAYNHADWYVNSVLMRAKLIGGLPADLVGSLSGLTQGHFPVAAKAAYADDINEATASRRVAKGTNAAKLVSSDPHRRSINIFAKKGSPVVAVNDGVIRKVGHSSRLGKYVVLQDVYGNSYTYGNLGKVAPSYPSPKPKQVTAAQIKRELDLPKADPKPNAPATAGSQKVAAAPQPVAGPIAPQTAENTVSVAKERLFAHPARHAAYKAGGSQQLLATGKPVAGFTTFEAYFTKVLGLKGSDVVLKKLKPGAKVVAGTILGRIDDTGDSMAPHVAFEIRPAGKGTPRIDPKPILDGWKLLESTAIYRAAGKNPFFGPDAKGPSIGQILLMSKEDLESRVLADPRVDIYACGRRDIRSGQIDRRVLATLEYLSASGLRPTISSLKCGHGFYTASGNVSEHSSGSAVDIAAVNGIPIVGHQGPGSITEMTIRRLLNLQGTMRPHQIISLMKFAGADNTFVLPDHYNHIHVGFRPLYSTNPKLAEQFNAVLKPGQWIKLIDRLNHIENPVVSTKPSKYAIPGSSSPQTAAEKKNAAGSGAGK